MDAVRMEESAYLIIGLLWKTKIVIPTWHLLSTINRSKHSFGQ